MNSRFCPVLATVLLLACATPASATLLTAEFAISGFTDIQSGGPRTPPLDPVSGSITYEAVGNQITALNGINLSIAGHSYTLAEIAFNDAGSGRWEFYGTVAGTPVLSTTDDFFLRLQYIVPDHLNLTQFGRHYMLYSVSAAGDRGLYDSFYGNGTVTVRDAQAGPVPEPATLLLLAAGIAGFAGVNSARKHREHR